MKQRINKHLANETKYFYYQSTQLHSYLFSSPPPGDIETNA